MADREKVCKELESLRDICNAKSNMAIGKGKVAWAGYANTADDAIALLKEQEAQVMTLEEVKAFDWEYCYLEEERLPGKEYRMVCGDHALTCITWPCVASMRIQHGDNSYGKKWRCWTSKPTNEQRTAVKWE